MFRVARLVLIGWLAASCSVEGTVLEPRPCSGAACGPPVAVATTPFGSSSVTSLATDGVELFYAASDEVWKIQASGPIEQSPVAIAQGESSATGVLVLTSDAVHWVTSGPAGLPYQAPSNVASAVPGSVRRSARSAGAVPETLHSGGSPCGLAVVGTRVFWVDRGEPELGLSNGAVMMHDGNVSTLVTGEAAPTGLVADDAHLYWTRYGTQASAYTDGAVVRARHDGSELTVLASGDLKANNLVQDASFLYLDGPEHILRVKKDGSGGLSQVTESEQDFDFDELATDGKHVYWTNYFAGWVQRIPTSGGDSELLAEGQVTPKLVALDDTYVYFAP
jgi:hypothetical protein